MAKNPVLEIAEKLVGYIRPIMDTALAEMKVDVKKNPKEYYSASRDLLRAVVACAAQKMMEDGANKQLVSQTIYEHARSIADTSWTLFLGTHPEVVKKIEMEKGKKDAESVAQATSFKKANPLKCLPGGLGVAPADETVLPFTGGGAKGTVGPPAGCACGKGEFNEAGECTCEVEDPEDQASNSDDPGCQGDGCSGCAECEPQEETP